MLGSMLRVLAIAIALCGCRDEGLDRLDDIRHEVCACETIACGEDAMKKVPQQGVTTDHRAQAIAREMMECMAKLYRQDRPMTDPDAAPAGDAGAR